MGKINKILKELQCGPGIYDRTARLELEENIHFHLDDLRFFLNKEDFLLLCDMFREAKERYIHLGQPESTKEMHLLSDIVLGEGDVKNRVGIEIQMDSRSHFHYNSLRVHLPLGDLMLWFEVFEQASKNIPDSFVKELTFISCDFHETVYEHLNIIEKYKNGDGFNPEELRVSMNNIESNCGDIFTRNFGLPPDFPKKFPKAVDHKYLMALYENIKKYGYAEGPYYRKYMVAYDLKSKPYILNSHRLAVLMALGYKKALFYVVEKESNWTDD